LLRAPDTLGEVIENSVSEVRNVRPLHERVCREKADAFVIVSRVPAHSRR